MTAEPVKKQPFTLHIKNMVCNRCIKVVREEFEKLELEITSISLGEVEITKEPGQVLFMKIRKVLEENGFELLEDKRAKTIEKLKSFLVKLIHHSDSIEDVKYSELIQNELGIDYTQLSSLFSSTEGITIEHFIILQKIERAKELLKYDELTLSEIAYKLGYSSVAHLSSQFKKITGMTASQFKTINGNKRRPIDKLH